MDPYTRAIHAREFWALPEREFQYVAMGRIGWLEQGRDKRHLASRQIYPYSMDSPSRLLSCSNLMAAS